MLNHLFSVFGALRFPPSNAKVWGKTDISIRDSFRLRSIVELSFNQARGGGFRISLGEPVGRETRD